VRNSFLLGSCFITLNPLLILSGANVVLSVSSLCSLSTTVYVTVDSIVC